VQGIGVFGYMYRGFSSVVAPSFGIPFGEDTTCISCGQCVSACPVGALTEKLPARKNVPLPEKTVEGTCARCSVGCGIDYHWHGSLFTRVTERYAAPNNGKLCKKGKFGHEFLNDAAPAGIDPVKTRTHMAGLLKKAKHPVMRISPYLCGEAIDAFLDAAARKGIPVRAAGLEKLDPRWAELAARAPAGSSDGVKPLILLIGDIAASNNVAFTEAYRKRRQGFAELWIAGHDDETARRAADRVISDVQAALAEAAASGSTAEVWVNPEEAPAGVLDSLLAVQDKVRIHLLWNSRNAGYLFVRQSTMQHAADLLLDVGVEESANGTKRIVWGRKTGAEDLFIPLPREWWLMGRSHPTAMPPVQTGTIQADALKAVLLFE
jgi:ferredoxin